MAKIFISYKYGDKFVRQYDNYNPTDWSLERKDGKYLTARHYVTYLTEEILTNHISKAEKDNEDLSYLTEASIQKKLYDRIYDSTVTIILLSKNMKENKSEKLQWIPQEVAYSLKEKTRNDRTSYTNGILLVALPDENNSYDHAFIEEGGVQRWQTNNFFNIIAKNMFNNEHKQKEYNKFGQLCYFGDDHSYIFPVTWDEFIQDSDRYIDHVLQLKNRVNEFNLTKTLDNTSPSTTWSGFPFSF